MQSVRYREQETEKNSEVTASEDREELIVSHREAADQLADDTLERSKHALSTLLRADEISTETLKELNAQGEQLKSAQEGVDTIRYQQEWSKRYERSIRSFFWTIINKFIPEPVRVDNTVNAADAAPVAAAPPAVRSVSITQSGVNTLFSGDTADAAIDRSQQTNRQKMAETDKHLSQMSDVLSGLQQKSVLMGDELDKQNEQLTTLKKTTDEANSQFNDLNRKVRRLL